MTYFTTDSNSVRAERFKPGGKWYDTWALKLPLKCEHDNCNSSWNCFDMWTLYAKAFEEAHGKPLAEGWTLVIFDPYSQFAHPIMLIGGQKGKS